MRQGRGHGARVRPFGSAKASAVRYSECVSCGSGDRGVVCICLPSQTRQHMPAILLLPAVQLDSLAMPPNLQQSLPVSGMFVMQQSPYG